MGMQMAGRSKVPIAKAAYLDLGTCIVSSTPSFQQLPQTHTLVAKQVAKGISGNWLWWRSAPCQGVGQREGGWGGGDADIMQIK